MIGFEQYVVFAVVAAFIGVGAFGLLAALHVDSRKKEEASPIVLWLRWGPWVPKRILTEKGKRFAQLRDLSALCCVVVVVVGGIVLRLRQG